MEHTNIKAPQSENQFFIDSKQLPPKALAKKHRLERDPSSRKNHMEYLPGMEQIHSDVCRNVLTQMESYDPSRYTARDVKAALEHNTCTIEDFKALLSPAADPFLEQMAARPDWRPAGISETPFICLHRSTLPITAKITASTVDSTVITISSA